jgi:hypothetical protein
MDQIFKIVGYPQANTLLTQPGPPISAVSYF